MHLFFLDWFGTDHCFLCTLVTYRTSVHPIIGESVSYQKVIPALLLYFLQKFISQQHRPGYSGICFSGFIFASFQNRKPFVLIWSHRYALSLWHRQLSQNCIDQFISGIIFVRNCAWFLHVNVFSANLMDDFFLISNQSIYGPVNVKLMR